jgi:hypothetical protein
MESLHSIQQGNRFNHVQKRRNANVHSMQAGQIVGGLSEFVGRVNPIAGGMGADGDNHDCRCGSKE